MSTHYYVHLANENRPTLEGLREQARNEGFTVELVPDPPPTWVAHVSEENYVHLEFDEDERLVGFERFGSNDVSWFIDLVGEDDVLSEHNDEYEDLYYAVNR